MNATGLGALIGVLALAGCQGHARAVRPAPPLGEEGAVLLYLEPLDAGRVRVDVTFTSAAVVAPDGTPLPLELVRGAASSAPPAHQRLLARGRLPPGEYAALLVGAAQARLERAGVSTALALPQTGTRVAAQFTIAAGQQTVLWLRLDATPWLAGQTGIPPALSAGAPPTAVPDLTGYCTNAGSNDLAVFDRVRQRVVAAVPTGRTPQGIVLDPGSTRAYVAVPVDGEIQVLDVAAGRFIGRVRLDPGDAPRDVALTPDARVLVVANTGTNSVSFVDAASWVELSRVAVGEAPSSIFLDRAGQRAYVLNSGSSSITVLDVAYRAVVGTLSLGAEPTRAALNAEGTLLYVTERGSQYLSIYSVPDLAAKGRIFVGLGATDVQVDPRTGRIYVASTSEARVDVLDAAASMPVGALDLPAPASRLLITSAERLLFALLPQEQAVAVVDLTSARVITVFDVGAAPFQLAISHAQP